MLVATCAHDRLKQRGIFMTVLIVAVVAVTVA